MESASHPGKIGLWNCLESTSKSQMAKDVVRGLCAPQKHIPSKYFYDAHGSRLFEQICRLPEYYLTRTELALLHRSAKKLIRGFGNGDIVELGSGANRKIRILLDAIDKSHRATIRYIPVDVSEDALVTATKGLAGLYPELKIICLVADFSRDLYRIPSDRHKLVMFLGSTIGNLDRDESRVFFGTLAGSLRPTDRFLLGLDMVKPVEIMEAAYNDSQNVTAKFNKNVLRVLNRELGANFHLDDFEHVAFFNKQLSQIEMHLRSKRRVGVRFANLNWTVSFDRDETIRTEISRKFTRSEIEESVGDAGFTVLQWHSDPKDWFSIAEIGLRGSE